MSLFFIFGLRVGGIVAELPESCSGKLSTSHVRRHTRFHNRLHAHVLHHPGHHPGGARTAYLRPAQRAQFARRTDAFVGRHRDFCRDDLRGCALDAARFVWGVAVYSGGVRAHFSDWRYGRFAAAVTDQKFSGQLLVAIILAYKSNVRITSLYGVFGVHELPELTSFVLSVIIIIAIINSFNLIDGINGLAGSIGFLACVSLGAWFLAIHSPALAVVAFSLAGAITAFLKYNFTPAQIFMGDTGSLLIGTVCAILSINFIEMNHLISIQPAYTFNAAPAIAVGILILPLYDTVRVFVQRILHGRSPFSPDKTHIHHLMLELGYSHTQSTAILLIVNIFFIGIAVLLDRFGTPLLLVLEIALMFLLTFTIQRLSKKRSLSGAVKD